MLKVDPFGGISGQLDGNSTIQKCYNTGNIYTETTMSVCGGIVGTAADKQKSIIEGCFNIGTVQGEYILGGVAGEISGNVILQNCYNHGKITGTTASNQSKVGGIAGQSTSQILNSYNTGVVNGTDEFVGGIIGYIGSSSTYNTIGKIKNVYTLDEAIPNIYGVNKNGIIEENSSKTIDELKNLATILGNAFKTDVNGGYPLLKWQ